MALAPCSNSKILMRERAGLKAPSCSKEQASSHCRHEVHLPGSIKSDFCISLPFETGLRTGGPVYPSMPLGGHGINAGKRSAIIIVCSVQHFSPCGFFVFPVRARYGAHWEFEQNQAPRAQRKTAGPSSAFLESHSDLDNRTMS